MPTATLTSKGQTTIPREVDAKEQQSRFFGLSYRLPKSRSWLRCDVDVRP